MKETGIIFDIARKSTKDGPGIRTTIFLKGCPLKCVWCHNPESRTFEPQLFFNKNDCHDCFTCLTVCKNEAHYEVGGEHCIDFERCDGDGYCIKNCPFGAVGMTGRSCSVEEILQPALEDKSTFGSGGGGVTISGGEPMSQFNFTYQLLYELKARGIHTCLDTSGYAKTELFEKIAPLVDLFLFDYKETDPWRHMEFTGVHPQLILKNLETLVRLGKQIILRCPVVPGYNDTEAHFRGIAEISALYGLKVEVLPFDGAAFSKAEKIGVDLACAEIPEASPEMSAAWERSLQDLGVDLLNKKPFSAS